MKRFVLATLCTVGLIAGCTEVRDDDAPLPDMEPGPVDTTTDYDTDATPDYDTEPDAEYDVTPDYEPDPTTDEVDPISGSNPEGASNYRGDIKPEQAEPNQSGLNDPNQSGLGDPTEGREFDVNPNAAPGTIDNVPNDATLPNPAAIDAPAVEEEPATNPPAELEEDGQNQ